jgi:hypothetical protein
MGTKNCYELVTDSSAHVQEHKCRGCGGVPAYIDGRILAADGASERRSSGPELNNGADGRISQSLTRAVASSTRSRKRHLPLKTKGRTRRRRKKLLGTKKGAAKKR